MRKIITTLAVFSVALAMAVPAFAQTMSPTLDPVALASIKTVSMLGLGWLWQYARSPKNWPNAVTWVLFSVGAILLYWWQTPSIASDDIRLTGLYLVNFILGARGAATTSKDAKLAPATDSK